MTQALDRATELVETGEHPTAALIKAANEHALSSGHARLAAVAYNTGRAAFQREESSDTNHKIAEFDLADPELVAGAITKTQKSAELDAPMAVSAVYSQPPTFLWAKYKQALAETEIPNLCERSVGDLPAAHTMDGIRVVSDVRSLHRKVADLRGITDKMLRDLDGRFDLMQGEFRVLGAPALATLQKAAADRRDAGVTAIFNEIGRRDLLLTKAAGSQAITLNPTAQRLYRQAEQMAQAAGEFIVANKKLAEVCDLVDLQTAAALDPFLQKESAAADPFFELNSVVPKRAAGPGLVRQLMAPFAGAAVGAHTDRDQDTNVRHYQMSLEDPGQDQTLRGLRARTTLEQLRATDPVLSGYKQEELVNAFNQIVQTAPEAAGHPIYMQAMLRRYLGQGNALDPDDIRSNVIGPQVDMAKSRLQATPELPPSSYRPATAGAPSVGSAMRHALNIYNKDGLI